VNVNTEARDKARFRRLRDNLWWKVREEFESALISIPDDPTLIEECRCQKETLRQLDTRLICQKKDN
jgi:hypothetical protein